MIETEDVVAALLERLRGREYRDSGESDVWSELVNPDGPEAADTIERLREENARRDERVAMLVEVVGKALTNVGENGYIPTIGAPLTEQLKTAYRAFGKEPKFGECVKW